MKQDRFLTGILIGVVLLVVAALVVFFTGVNRQNYLPEDSPDAVVLNYVLALQEGDYQKAYGYLADRYEQEAKPGFGEFRSYFSSSYRSFNNSGINILSVEEVSGQAWVTVEVAESYGGLFNEVYRSEETAVLVKDSAGDWKLIRMPYQFWQWEWYGNAKIYP